jgi:integrase
VSLAQKNDHLTQLINEANDRLKIQNIGFRIDCDGLFLRLRGLLPPRPNAPHKMPSQQRICPGLRATPSGVKAIEKLALKLRLSLDEGRFDWSPYIRQHLPLNDTLPTPHTVGEWVTSFEIDYFSRRRTDQQTLTTWRTEYKMVFRRLPPEARLTSDLLLQTILATPPDTKTRKRFCICLGALAKFAQVQLDTTTLKGNYNPKRVTPRQIPEDELIVEWFYKIPSPAWRWVYGMIATYGLRNHEVFRVDLEEFTHSHICTVLEGKTGGRRIWPFHIEWVEEFDLHTVNLPAVSLARSNAGLGGDVSQMFRRSAIEFPPYNLRHAWAIRTLEYGLEISLASQQMGHSQKVHSELYHHWISEKQHQRAFELLLKRADRPRPPVVNPSDRE